MQIHVETRQPKSSVYQSAFHIQARQQRVGQQDCPDISAGDIVEVQPALICQGISLTAPINTTQNDNCAYSKTHHLYAFSDTVADLSCKFAIVMSETLATFLFPVAQTITYGPKPAQYTCVKPLEVVPEDTHTIVLYCDPLNS